MQVGLGLRLTCEELHILELPPLFVTNFAGYLMPFDSERLCQYVSRLRKVVPTQTSSLKFDLSTDRHLSFNNIANHQPVYYRVFED